MADTTLEGLPTELIIHILWQIPDRKTLQSLVLTSPACHAAYLMVRSKLLHCILRKQYDPSWDLSEAITAIRSKGLYMAKRPGEAIAMLDSWRRRDEIRELQLTPETQLDEPNSLEEVIELLHFYDEMAFFVDDYAKNAPCPQWMDADRWHNQVLPLTLSTAEKLRIFRALCRLQITAHIFGRKEQHLDADIVRGLNENWPRAWLSEEDDRDVIAWRLFYGTMAPWEKEEMGCVWAYLWTKYNPVHEEIANSLRNCGCTFFWELPDDQCPAGYVIETERDLDDLPRSTDGLLSLGPRFLYKVLHSPWPIRRDLVTANVQPCAEKSFVDVNLWMTSDEKLPLLYPADKYDLENLAVCVSGLPVIEQPNFGWATRVLGEVPPGEDMQDLMLHGFTLGWEWGYAIWDGEKLKDWNAPLAVKAKPKPVGRRRRFILLPWTP